LYVRAQAAATTPAQILDQHIAGFFRAARQLGLPAAEVRARVAEWLAAPPPDRLLVIDPDAEVRKILVAEVAAATGLAVAEASLEDCAKAGIFAGAVPLCRPSKTAAVRALVPTGIELVTLQIRSANTWLAPWLPAPQGHLIGVASRWPEFLATARTMLTAAGLPMDAMVFRDARRARWQSGLEQAAAILCDAYTASLPGFPKRPHVIVFPLLADGACSRLAALCGQA
jgi:GntR family transcriptional regulator